MEVSLLLVLFAQLYSNSLNIPHDNPLHLVCTANRASSLFIALSSSHFSNCCHVFAAITPHFKNCVQVSCRWGVLFVGFFISLFTVTEKGKITWSDYFLLVCILQSGKGKLALCRNIKSSLLILLLVLNNFLFILLVVLINVVGAKQLLHMHLLTYTERCF